MILPRCFDPAKSNGTCPLDNSGDVCASPDTPIVTPTGDRAIATLVPGDLVYSVDRGQVTIVPIRAVHRIPAHDHHVVKVVLSGGATIEISAPHPTADGRRFADLRAGDRLGEALVVRVSVVPYTFDFTYDVLPDSETGTYFAAGALVGSTLGGSALLGVVADFEDARGDHRSEYGLASWQSGRSVRDLSVRTPERSCGGREK